VRAAFIHPNGKAEKKLMNDWEKSIEDLSV